MGKALIFGGVQVETPLQTVTLIQTGLINPTLSISSGNEETDTTFSFTISADNAIKVYYIVKESSESAPSDIFSEGQSITISELPKKIIVSGKSPETTYIIYAGAISSDNVKVEKNISITTKEKVLTTADEYVDEYAKLATEVTEEQKGYLKTFVGTLISSKLWDKVRCCFPMLGGLSGYNKDLKDVHNQKEWNIPPTGVSWDDTRNAPFLSLPGLAEGGKSIYFDDLDNKSCAFLLSMKSIRANMSGMSAISDHYKGEAANKSFVTYLYPQNGGYQFPIWSTDGESRNLENYTAFKNKNLIFTLSLSEGVNKLYTNKSGLNTGEVIYVSQKNTNTLTECQFAIGGSYAAEMEAPAIHTLNGCANMFIAFQSSLTEEEIQTIFNAVWTFDESCGRHIDFE